MIEFSKTVEGRYFFRNIQKISDSLKTIAEGTEPKNLHQHRIGAAQRISLAIDYINDNINVMGSTEHMDIPIRSVIDLFAAIKKILLKSS